MKLFVKSKKMLVILALFIGIFGFVLLNNKKVEDKTIYKDGIKMLDYNQVQVGEDAITGTEKVKFDAFFLEGTSGDEASRFRGKSINVSESAKLWLELQINGGATLKDAYIEFQNSNVRIEGAVAKDTVIKDTIVSNNITRIPLNEVNVGTTKMFYLNITPNLTYNIKSYNGTNKVILKGTVLENDVETEIEKEVEYTVNFYGTADSIEGEIERISETAPMVPYGSDETVTVTYNVRLKETKDLMLLKSTNIEAVIGKLNGFDPLSVSLSGAGFAYEYDETTNTLTARREAVVENDRIQTQAYSYKEQINNNNNSNYYSVDSATGIVKANNGTYSDPNNINNSSYRKVNEITITVVYPNEASYKTGTAVANLNLWYEAFNNEELTDAVTESNKTSRLLIANYQCDDTKGTVSTVFTHVTINNASTNSNEESRIDSTLLANKYKGVDSGNIMYYIYISPYVGGYNPAYEIGGLTIYDLGNNYMNQNISMKEFEKYYAIGLSSNIINYIGVRGTVKVIDADTNEIVHVFNKDNYNQTYVFNTDVRSIKLEISDIDDLEIVKTGINNDLFNIMLMKEIDTDYIVNNVSKEEFETWNHVYTTIRTDWTAGEYTSENDVENIADSEGRRVQRVSALFSEGLSRVNLSVDTTDTRNRLEVNIDTDIITSLYKGYKNGEFLLELPDAILDYNVVEDNIKYEKLEKDGHNLLKVIVENYYPDRYNLTFHLDIVPDVRTVNETIYYKLYAYNPNCHNYYGRAQDIYDVNGNNDTSEYVGYDSVGMNLISPSEVITAASLVDYNTNSDITVSPMIAEVDPVNDNGNAKVSIYVINNSGYGIKDTKVIGKLAFIGNTNQIDGSDLNSEFDVHMTNTGITYPTELDGYVTIYYSESENPTDDLTDANNGWTETPADFSLVKSYMIIIDDYEIANQENVTFEYSIIMPTDTENLLKKSYFTHAVYYKMITEDGLVPLSVGSSKLGVTMVRKYDLNIETLRKGTDKEVDLITYELEDSEGNIITISPSSTGLEAKGLYVNQIYKLRQKKISNNYEIDSEEKTFEITNGTNDVLEINTTGTYKSSELNNRTLNLTIENYPRYTVVINATDIDTNANIYGATFRVYGKGYTSYNTVMTNVNGEVTFKNLYLNEKYTVYENSAPGHQSISNGFEIMLKYDDATGGAKLTINKKPNLSDPIATSDSATSRFEVVSETENSKIIHNNSTTANQNTKAYMELDLTEYSNTYYIRASIDNYAGHIDMYATDYYVSNVSDITTSTFFTYNHTNNYEAYVSPTVYNAYKTDGTTTQFVGGKKYYIYLNQYTMNTSRQLDNIKFTVSTYSSNPEFFKTNELTVNIDANGNIVGTLDDNLSNSQPIMHINVKNNAMPTATLKLAKKDADNGTLLPNALYRLTGPGINDSILLRTNENGEAEYDIYYHYEGSYSAAGYPWLYEANAYYTLTEVSAPLGYAIDKSEVSFKLVDYITCPSGVVCSRDNAIHEFKIIYDNGSDEFKEASYDIDSNILNANVFDYPLVKIKKTDKDTGEFLPNTMFAINKVVKENGREIVEEALDLNGNPVGEEITIDGKTYRVITTNANGEITLNLPKGQYKIKEVQASSDKYEISKQVKYFGVGETVPYQAEGINFVEGFNTNDINVPLIITNTNISYDNVKNGTYQPSKDGGFYYYNFYFLAKYDKDNNLEWIHQHEILTDDTNTSQCFYRANLTFTYPDKDPMVENACLRFYNGISKLFETDSGDIFIADGGSAYAYADVYDENNNQITYRYPYIQLDRNGNISQNYKPTVIFQERKNITDANQVNKFNRTENDNEMYTSHYLYYNSWYNTTTNTEDTKGRSRLNGYDFNGYTGYYFVDAASTPDNGYIVLFDGPSDSNKSGIIVKYDANGTLVTSKELNSDMQSISTYTVSSSGFAPNTKVMFDSENNLVLSGYFNYKRTSIYENYSYGLIRLKYDNDLNLIYAKSSPYAENNYYRYHVGISSNGIMQINDDDSYLVKALYINYKDDRYADPDGYTYTNNDYFNLSFSDYTGNFVVLRYDEDGNAMNAINIGRIRPDMESPETNKYVVKGIESYYVFDSSGSTFNVIPSDNGIIVSTYYDPRNYEGYNGYYGINKVVLASGEEVEITGNYIIYKVNNDSKIEWLKQYNINQSYYNNYKPYVREDGSIVYVLKNSISAIKDEENNYIFGDDTGNVTANVLIFKPSDEVLASGPEAYTLNVENEAKKFDIKVTSDEGSTYSVKDSNNQVVFNGSGTYTAEKVTYDENSENEITITLKPNYVLKSVKMNGKDFTYQVNNDGTITLDKIPNVKENKTIEIETEEGLLSVVVHHYLENTTDRVASDEILTGNPNDYYDALPFVSNLYSLITDEDGNYIMPDNHHMKFNEATGDVIFYYRENNVELNVNYYIDNTEDELAPTIVEKKLLGSSYTTEPLDIDFYRVSRVLGDESGILSQDKTVVTYFYQEVTSTLTIKHLDINTREEVAPTETREIRLNEQYETSASNLIPVNYKNVSRTNNANDIATKENIEVIYYYDIIPFNVSVDKRIGSITVNGENININDSKSTKINATKDDEVIVYYEIELKNNGDIKALFKVNEEDVNNFEIYDLGEFTETNEGYILEATLEPGESKTYRIGYKWNQGKYGISTNEVEINDVSNELGFDEPDSSDNKSITAILIEDKDVLGEKDFNPNTSDNIYKSIIIFILSMYGLLFITFMYMIKKKFER